MAVPPSARRIRWRSPASRSAVARRRVPLEGAVRAEGPHRSRRPARTTEAPTPSARPTSPIRPSAMTAISRGSGSQERGGTAVRPRAVVRALVTAAISSKIPAPMATARIPSARAWCNLTRTAKGPPSAPQMRYIRQGGSPRPSGRSISSPASRVAPAMKSPSATTTRSTCRCTSKSLSTVQALPPTGSRTSRTPMRSRGIAAARLPSRSRIRSGPTPGAGTKTASAPRCIGWASDSRCQKARSSGARSSVLNGGLMSSERRGRGRRAPRSQSFAVGHGQARTYYVLLHRCVGHARTECPGPAFSGSG